MKKLFFFLLLSFLTRQEAQAQDFYIVKNLANQQDTLCFRDSTRLIIIHTTDGFWPGCSDWLKQWHIGNYVVTRKGRIEALTDDERYVNHAGHSIWQGDTDVSYFSVGIELEQYKGSLLTSIQLEALAWLVDSLEAKYGIPDSCVLIHPAVACFYPRENGSHGYYRRGRKHDALEFTDNDFRAKAGLGPGPKYDPDVMGGNVVADPYQERLLYGRNFSEEEKSVYQTSLAQKAHDDSVRCAQTSNVVQPIVCCTIRCLPLVHEDEIMLAPLAIVTPDEQVKRKIDFFILPRRQKFFK